MSRPIESTFRVTLKAIAAYSSDPQARELALAALAEEAPRSPASSPRLPPSGGPRTSTDRVREWRAARREKRDETPDATDETPGETPHETGDETPFSSLSSSPSSLLKSSKSQEEGSPISSGNARDGNAETPRVTPSETRIRNASADGCFGDSVATWVEGVKSVTGKPFLPPPPGSGELAKLVGAIVALCPDVSKRLEWARTNGAAFARARAGKTLSVHAFVDWLNSPEATSGEAPGAAEHQRQKDAEEQARIDREHRKRRGEAVPMPADLMATILKRRTEPKETGT